MPAGFKKNRRDQKSKVISQKHRLSKSEQGSFRIIGGKWRSRRLSFPAIEGLRPTTDRVKETLFNWLTGKIEGAKVLDLFAGSGSLGFEALSRGAASLSCIEKDKHAAKALQSNLSLLIKDSNDADVQVTQIDALAWLAQVKQKCDSKVYDLVLLDPPFRKGLLAECLSLLEGSTLISTGAIIYVEREKEQIGLEIPNHWQLMKEKVAGQVCYQLYKVI